ncbi:MAG: hypothetical protein ACXQTL_05505 [Methanosarcinales archaeon]
MTIARLMEIMEKEFGDRYRIIEYIGSVMVVVPTEDEEKLKNTSFPAVAMGVEFSYKTARDINTVENRFLNKVNQ